MLFYRGCTALVTGASSGLGSEFALQLAPYAARLILVARRTDRLEELKAALEAEHPHLQVFTYGLDLADTSKLDAFLRWLEDAGLRINILVNNAGLGDHGPFEESDPERIRAMIYVNIAALTLLSRALLPHLRSYAHGAVINVSSIAGLLPIPGMAVYAATKAYVNSFSESLRAELRDTGISITALCPGPVPTEFGKVARRSDTDSMPAPAIMTVPAERVVRAALHAASADKPRIIPGLLVCAVMTVAAAVPLCILRHFLCAPRRGR